MRKIKVIVIFILSNILLIVPMPALAKGYAVVTGASRGIGKSIAGELWVDGYSLILISRSAEMLESVKAELKPQNKQDIQLYSLDLTNEKDCEKFFKEIKQKNLAIEVLINNAGIFKHGTSSVNSNAFLSLIDTNLIAAHNMVRNILPIMLKHGTGYIINISSFAGNHAVEGWGAYSASKYALKGYTDSLLKELAGSKIKVTSISPSLTNTIMTKGLAGFNSSELIQTSDISKTVIFLLSLGKSVSVNDVEIDNRKVVAHNNLNGDDL